MPEGPEVAVVTDFLKKAVGKKYLRIDVVENIPEVKHRFTKTPIAKLDSLTDFVLVSAGSRGKLIVLKVKTEADNHWIFNTLGMSGSWVLNGKTEKHARLNLVSADGQSDLTFVDPRCFGSFRILSVAEAARHLTGIGHDLLKSPALPEVWKDFQNNKKIADKPIGPALLDQRLFSGIGNIYKSELLYQCKINPRSLVKNVPKEKWDKINREAHELLQRAYKAGGSSVESFSSDRKEGDFQNQLKIYGKQVCPEGHPIWSFDQDGRTTWYCATCQV